MTSVMNEIWKVKSKATSYKTAWIKTKPVAGWEYWILGYSKGSGICTVLVKSPYCPCGEYGTVYFQEVATLQVDPGFVETPSSEVRQKLW